MTSKVAFGRDGPNLLPMKRPYSRRISMWSVDSGAAAYSQGTPRFESPHEAGAGRLSGFLVSVMTGGLWHRSRPASLPADHDGTRSSSPHVTFPQIALAQEAGSDPTNALPARRASSWPSGSDRGHRPACDGPGS